MPTIVKKECTQKIDIISQIHLFVILYITKLLFGLLYHAFTHGM